MKIIQARAWFKGRAPFEESWDKPRMFYGVESLYDGSIDGLGSYGSFGHLIDNDEEFAVMMWTGEVDKGGHKIYDGDILEVQRYGLEEKHRTKVRFESGGFIVEDDFGEADLLTIGWAIESWEADGHEYFVIGNAHENPDLLK